MNKFLRLLMRPLIVIIGSIITALGSLKLLLREGISLRYFCATHSYPAYLRCGNAAAFCYHHARQYCKGQGLDIGPSRWIFDNARGIERGATENALRIKEADASQDFVFSSHCLEHIDAWKEALAEWIRVLRNGGILYLYLPHPVARMWQPGIHPDHHVTLIPELVAKEIIERRCEVISISYLPDAYLSFHIVARKG